VIGVKGGMMMSGINAKVPVTTHLLQWQVGAINRIARDRQVTKAAIFRMAIANFIKEYGEKCEHNLDLA